MLSLQQLRCEYLSNPLGIDVAAPRLSWTLAAETRGQYQQAYQILVASSETLLAQDHGDLWDSGQVASDETAQIAYAGQPLLSGQRAFWKVRVWDREGQVSAYSDPAWWEMGLLQPEEWTGRWITHPEIGKAPYLRTPLLRTRFQLGKTVARARAYICSAGYYALYLNGERVGDHVLDPVQSDFTKTVYYITYDVTAQCRSGANALGIWLGFGWYNKNAKPSYGVMHDGPVAMAQLVVDYTDGTREVIATDGAWKAAQGPITPMGTFHLGDAGGEYYDAREEIAGWADAEFNDSHWYPAQEVVPPLGTLRCQMMAPTRVKEAIHPIGVEPHGDGYLLDMGRCYTGWLQVRLPAGEAGQQITFRFGDCLTTDGDLDGIYGQQDIYVMKGGEGETFCSHFNYHAFRHVEILNYPGVPVLEQFTGHLVCTDVASAGNFECSNPLFNQIFEMERWTYRSCILGGVPVDTPNRERLGYGMDGANSLEQAIHNFDMPAFLTKWAQDWREAQDTLSGCMPHIAPYRVGSGGGPSWGSACVLTPWFLYRYYGDTRVLDAQYDAMVRWLAYLDTKMRGDLIQYYKLRTYDADFWEFLSEWVPPRGDMTMPPEQWPNRQDNILFSTVFHYNIVSIVSKVAALLGKPQAAEAYAARAEAIKAAINAHFFDVETGLYGNGDQTYLAMALEMGIVPEEHRARVLQNLIDDIYLKHDGHLDTGLRGTQALFTALRRAGRSDVLNDIANQRTFPSWGWMIDQGATTIWEEWRPGHSRIHILFLTFAMWLYKGLAGIDLDPEAPGFSRFIIKPEVLDDLTYARGSYHSLRGEIRSGWERQDDALHLTVTIPANTTARVYVPTADPATILIDGQPAADCPQTTYLQYDNGRAVFTVPSGTYTFKSALQ